MAKSRRKRQQEDFSFFAIDEFNLEKEWVEQPQLFFTWARKLADARVALDEAKTELDVTRAEVSRAIRDSPEDYGLEKVTEAGVSAAIPEEPSYMAASKAVTTAKHDVDIYQAAVTALEHRKRALEKLVDLHGQNYFSAPRTPDTEMNEKVKERSKQTVRRKSRS